MKAASVAAGCLLALCASQSAQSAERTYPTRTVTIVVPSTAGSGADIVARLVAQRLSEAWGQAVVVDNKDGASGSIGAAIVAKAAPDGHTLCMAFVNHTISPSLYNNIPFDILRSFKPVVRTAQSPLAIIASPGFEANTVPQLIALTKSRPASAEIFFGSPGMGSVNGLALEMLKQKANFNMRQAPYKGNAQMVSDVMGNQIPLGAAVVASVHQQVKAGKLKALAVTSKNRSASLPDVPSVSESGIADYDIAAWNGLLAPANTPDAIVAEVYTTVSKAMQTREFRELLANQGADVVLLNPQEFKAFLASEVAQWAAVVKTAGVKAD